MVISLNALVELLDKSGIENQDVPAAQALAIDLGVHPTRSKDSQTFTTAEGGTLVVDLDEAGEVASIEIIP